MTVKIGNSTRRVVVVDIGVISSLGSTFIESWNNLIAGKSGITRVQEDCLKPHTIDDYVSKVAGHCNLDLKDMEISNIEKKELNKRMDRFVQLALAAALQLDRKYIECIDPDMVGVIGGAGIGGVAYRQQQTGTLLNRGPSRVSPFLIPIDIIDIVNFWLSLHFRVYGANFATVSACASGPHNVFSAFNAISMGYIDACITGGSEAPLCATGFSGFGQATALSTKRNDEPEKASRPFDLDRDGFVMAEGAGELYIVEHNLAVKNGMPILAEIVGIGVSGDAYGLTEPDPSGNGIAKAMASAIKMAGIKPEDIAYLNPHGTSTPLGDKAEIKAIKQVFGDSASRLYVSSTKSATGHSLGAVGTIELGFCVKVLETGIIPPTLNLDNLDPECEGVRHVTHESVQVDHEVEYVMSNSLGFGGHNISIILKKYTV